MTLSKRKSRKARLDDFELGAILSPQQLTDYILRHKLRNTWGIMDEPEIKQTISFAADYWRLEEIDISRSPYIADPKYRNRSKKAHPIVHYFGSDNQGNPVCDVLDGRHRIGMARARGEKTIRAWVGHVEPAPPKRVEQTMRAARQ